MTRAISLMALLSMAMTLVACSGASTATNTGNPGLDDPTLPEGIELVRSALERDETPDLSEAELDAFGASGRDLALALYAEIKAETGNLFISPYSIATALSMLHAGAEAETETEMINALRFDLPEPKLYAAFNATDLALSGRAEELAGDEFEGAPESSGDGLQLNVINSAFGRVGTVFREPYLDVLAEHYGTGMFTTDFGDSEAARKRINDWVLAETNDRIDELLPPGSIFPEVILVLVNAIYFKASWLDPFDAADTTKATFHAEAGEVEVDMMQAMREAPYAEGDGYQALALPYISPAVRMIFVLPEEGRFDEIESGFDRTFVDGIVDTMSDYMVEMQVPKFSYEAELTLKPVLQSLGMEKAFVPNEADLSGITRGPGEIWVDEVYHKAFVAIDEQGTEAAAATAVVVRDESAPPPATFVLDRPFLFMIYDRPTGQILFLGRVLDPTL